MKRPRRPIRAIAEPCEPRVLLAGYHLTFDDEFNSLTLATGPTSSGWLTTDYYASPFFSGEQEYYALQNGPHFTDSYNPFSINSGVLTITAQPNKNANGQSIVTTTTNPNYAYDQQPYLSGELTSSTGQPGGDGPQGLGFAQKYGYFEIRAELPNTQGVWPAFWLIPADGSGGAEYDIFEDPINTSTTDETATDIYQTAHWGGYAANDPHVNQQGIDFNNGTNTSTGFHTYGLSWTPTTLTWYVDGQPTQTQINRSDQPMYMIMNLAIGGSWPGDANGSSVFPAQMKVDWVHVYSSDPNVPAVTPQPSYAASLPASVGTVDSSGTTYAGLLDGSFETTFSTNGATNDVTGTPWSFSGTAGVLDDNATSYGQTAAPDGTHAAFIQQIGSFSQTFTAPAANSGTYSLSFLACNRTTATDRFTISVNGSTIGTFNPTANDTYGSYTTATFTLAAGTDTITFTGLNSTSGDADFVDDLQLNAISVNGVNIGAPSSLTASPGSVEGTTTLNWTDAANSNATGYQIERRTSPTGGWSIIASVGASATSFSDSGVTTEPDIAGPITYRVASINSTYGVTSAYTNSATVTPPTSPIAPPTDLVATASTSAITLSWLNNSYYSTAILIYRKTGTNGTWAQLADTYYNTSTYTDTTAVLGDTYYYQVRVQGVIISGSPGSYTTTTAYSAYSPIASSTLLTSSPSSLSASATSPSSISLTWSAPTAGASGYNIYRGTNAGAESTTPINSTPVTTTSYTDTTAAPGTTYYYTVSAVLNGTTTGTSNEASASTITLAPAYLRASASGASSTAIDLGWIAPSGTVTGYNIYRGTTSGGESGTPINSTPLNSNTYVDSGLSTGTTYYYTVVALSSGGSSAASIEAAATPASPASTGQALYTDSLQNNASYYSNPSGSTFSTLTSPVFAGTSAFTVTPKNSGTAVGLTGGTLAVPIGETTLQFAIDITKGAGVTSFIAQLGAPTNSSVTFTSSNSSLWTLDGNPGSTTFTANVWHIVRLNLASAFGSSLIPGTTKIADFSAVTSAASQTIVVDQVSFAPTLPSWLTPASSAGWNPFTQVLTVTGPTTLNADPGTDEPTIQASGAAAVISLGPTNATAIHLGGLSLTNGATATVTSLGSARSTNNYHLLVIGTPGAPIAPIYNIDSTSALDLADNDMAILYGNGTSPIGSIETQLATAYDNGAWDKPGLTSSVARTQNGATALGYGEANTLGFATFDGQSLGGNAVVVKYTLVGDTNLDGTVDGTDYDQVLNAYDTAATWTSGDFFYAGTVSGSDYVAVLNNYDDSLANLLPGGSAPALTPAAATAGTATGGTTPLAPAKTTNTQNSLTSVGSASHHRSHQKSAGKLHPPSSPATSN
jgi:beta-glucanase (GH16 family)/fibronectin type 3 domain-containing protein